jgi:hypothetical protein
MRNKSVNSGSKGIRAYLPTQEGTKTKAAKLANKLGSAITSAPGKIVSAGRSAAHGIHSGAKSGASLANRGVEAAVKGTVHFLDKKSFNALSALFNPLRALVHQVDVNRLSSKEKKAYESILNGLVHPKGKRDATGSLLNDTGSRVQLTDKFNELCKANPGITKDKAARLMLEDHRANDTIKTLVDDDGKKIKDGKNQSLAYFKALAQLADLQDAAELKGVSLKNGENENEALTNALKQIGTNEDKNLKLLKGVAEPIFTENTENTGVSDQLKNFKASDLEKPSKMQSLKNALGGMLKQATDFSLFGLLTFILRMGPGLIAKPLDRDRIEYAMHKLGKALAEERIQTNGSLTPENLDSGEKNLKTNTYPSLEQAKLFTKDNLPTTPAADGSRKKNPYID